MTLYNRNSSLPQLCVDASIFIPENECTCYATSILFDTITTATSVIGNSGSPLPISSSGLILQTLTHKNDLIMENKIATINVVISNTLNSSNINVATPTIIGDNVPYLATNSSFVTNDPTGCYVSMFYGQGNFTLTAQSTNPPLVFPGNSTTTPSYTYVYDIKFMGFKIGELNFDVSIVETLPAVTWNITNVIIDNLVSYPDSTTLFNNDSVNVVCKNETPADCCNTHAENIGAASLILSLKANKNLIGKFDKKILKKGTYKLCIGYKPWNVGFENVTWELREIVEFVLTDETLNAYWGCATSKKGQRIESHSDKATLYPGNIEIQSSGNSTDVLNNFNDFVLIIPKVLQTFSAVGPANSTTSFVVTTGINATMPYSATSLILNNLVVNSMAKLANSKIHVALKYEKVPQCPVPTTFTPDDKVNRENFSIGSLSPFKRGVTNTINSIFVSEELISLQDHIFQNSNMTSNVSVCLTSQAVNRVR